MGVKSCGSEVCGSTRGRPHPNPLPEGEGTMKRPFRLYARLPAMLTCVRRWKAAPDCRKCHHAGGENSRRQSYQPAGTLRAGDCHRRTNRRRKLIPGSLPEGSSPAQRTLSSSESESTRVHPVGDRDGTGFLEGRSFRPSAPPVPYPRPERACVASPPQGRVPAPPPGGRRTRTAAVLRRGGTIPSGTFSAKAPNASPP